MPPRPNPATAHTPGPWIAYEELLTPGGLHAANRGPTVRWNGHVIASVNRFLDHRLNHHICEEAEANGRLISKAPEMEAYIVRKAEAGDQEAKDIMASIANSGTPHDGNHHGLVR
jgi:hypothetical protein